MFVPNARGLNECNSQRQWVGPLRLSERKRAVVLLYCESDFFIVGGGEKPFLAGGGRKNFHFV